ncbi:MAG: TonB-dependent receptor [Spirochaetaceae bacterium]|nr:MAG: TonB-dependent receptor [Spirochaetaceae bacterium]
MNFRILASLLATALLLVPGSAVADSGEGDTPQAGPVIDVVITADRVLTDIVSTAAHVSIITADDIRQSGATNVVELLDRQPGVSFRSFSNEAQAQVDMRGFGEGSYGRVLVLVDGRRQNNPDMSGINWLSIPIDSIERIEVVRGSESALYGNNAVAGVINIITKTPERPLELSAAGSFGSFMANQQRLGLATAGERARLRASAEHFSTDGHRDRSAYRALNFSLAGEFDPTDRLSLSLGGRYANVFYELPGGLTKEEFEDDPSQAKRDAPWPDTGRIDNDEDEATENQFGVDAGVLWQLGDRMNAELALAFSHKEVETDFTSEFNFSDTNLNTVAAAPAIVIDWDLSIIPVRTRFGVDWDWARQDGKIYDSADRDNKTDEFALSQWTISTALANTLYLTEQMDVGAALRYDRSVIAATKEAEDIDESKTHQAVVFDISTVFRPVESAKIYVSGGTLFRYPALDEQGQVRGFADGFNEKLDPETGFNVELGGGLYLLPAIRADVSVYLLQMRDEIAYDDVENRNINFDQTRRIGADLQISTEPIEPLRLAAGYSYVNAVFIKGDDRDNQVPLVPNHSIDAELGVRPLRGLEFGPAVTYRSQAYQGGDTGNEQDKIDAYFVTDLFVRFRPAGLPGDLSLSAEVKNLFDLNYAPLVAYSEWAGSSAYYPAPGRSFRIAAAYSY